MPSTTSSRNLVATLALGAATACLGGCKSQAALMLSPPACPTVTWTAPTTMQPTGQGVAMTLNFKITNPYTTAITVQNLSGTMKFTSSKGSVLMPSPLPVTSSPFAFQLKPGEATVVSALAFKMPWGSSATALRTNLQGLQDTASVTWSFAEKVAVSSPATIPSGLSASGTVTVKNLRDALAQAPNINTVVASP